ncbi:ROK family protein [Leifsonia sp. YAF41]|uniref:ROK family protein n=1 Tax=Leifsonia sp. YAF41 TaxID=3233086 RepID=UPI003F9C2235
MAFLLASNPGGTVNSRETPPGDAVLGIDFGGTKVALCLESAGEILAEVRLPIAAGEPAQNVVDRTIDSARELLSGCAREVVAVGIATPGIVHEHGIQLAPNVDGWSDLSLRTLLQDGLGIDLVVVENDVKSAALAEATSGSLVGFDPGFYLNLGTGIAAAMVVNGAVVQGAHGASGEIGYGVVGAASLLDWSGKRAPLEEHIGGRGLGERGAGRFGTSVSARAVLELAEVNPEVAEFLGASLDELARHILTCVLLLDPQRVVVGGGMSGATQQIIDPIRARLNSALAFPPEVVQSSFGAGASLRGAIELAHGLAAKPSLSK